MKTGRSIGLGIAIVVTLGGAPRAEFESALGEARGQVLATRARQIQAEDAVLVEETLKTAQAVSDAAKEMSSLRDQAAALDHEIVYHGASGQTKPVADRMAAEINSLSDRFAQAQEAVIRISLSAQRGEIGMIRATEALHSAAQRLHAQTQGAVEDIRVLGVALRRVARLVLEAKALETGMGESDSRASVLEYQSDRLMKLVR